MIQYCGEKKLQKKMASFEDNDGGTILESDFKSSRCLTVNEIRCNHSYVTNSFLRRMPRLQKSGSLKSTSPLPNLAFNVWGEYSQNYFL